MLPYRVIAPAAGVVGHKIRNGCTRSRLAKDHATAPGRPSHSMHALNPHSPHKAIEMRGTLCLSALLFCVKCLAHPHHLHLVEGSLSAGPSDQGTCARSDSRTDTFSCSNGATCQWQTDSLAFSCSTSNLLAADDTSGPPGRACTSHGDHYECDDGSLCQIVDGVWLCEVSEPHSSDSCNGVDLGDYDLKLHIIALL